MSHVFGVKIYQLNYKTEMSGPQVLSPLAYGGDMTGGMYKMEEEGGRRRKLHGGEHMGVPHPMEDGGRRRGGAEPMEEEDGEMPVAEPAPEDGGRRHKRPPKKTKKTAGRRHKKAGRHGKTRRHRSRKH